MYWFMQILQKFIRVDILILATFVSVLAAMFWVM